MAERPTQNEEKHEVKWPQLESAEGLQPLFDDDGRRIKLLALYEKRRLNNMPPPTFREAGKYLEMGDNPTSVVQYMIKEMVKKGYLNNWSGDEKIILSRGTTIRVDFQTIKLNDGNFADISNKLRFPDIPGLTQAKVAA